MYDWNTLRLLHRAWRLRLKHDRAEVAFLFQNVAPGEVVLDIGANKAGYTYWLHKAVGKEGHVVAFEPQPDLAQFIVDMKSNLRMENVTVVNSGLSSRAGECKLFHPAAHPLGGATFEHYSTAGTFTTVTVRTLDEYFSSSPKRPVSFIKCDVEGHELDVFKGAEELLRTDRPTLLFECSTPRTEAVFSYLTSLGYEGIAAFDHSRQPVRREFSEFDPKADPYQFNYGFVHQQRLASHRKSA